MTYELSKAQKPTLDSLREKREMFGLEWHEHVDDYKPSWFDKDNDAYVSDESAYWLMAGRAMQELAEQEGGTWTAAVYRLSRLRGSLRFKDDILAAVLAALGDKT